MKNKNGNTNQPEEDLAHVIPIILMDESSVFSYSIFNSANWSCRDTKRVINSCAMQHSLLNHAATKAKTLFQTAQEKCEHRFEKLEQQWGMSNWDVKQCQYLVEIPEVHLYIHTFLTTVKSFLDLIVQLVATEDIVNSKINGFHKSGTTIGGKLLKILDNNATKGKKETASHLHKLIVEQKDVWIDAAVGARDLLVHPEKGKSQVMFQLEIQVKNSRLKLGQIIKPSINNQSFDKFAETVLRHIEDFAKTFLGIVKNA